MGGQVAFADRILVNKTDLVEESELPPLERRLRSLNPTAQLFRTQQSQLDPKELLGIKAFSVDRALEMDHHFLDVHEEEEDHHGHGGHGHGGHGHGHHDHEHDPSVSSTSVKFEGYLNTHKLEQLMRAISARMGENLFRSKGVLSIAGTDAKFLFQGVGMIFEGGFVETVWEPGEPRENRFVFIGKDLDKKALRDGFLACKCEKELRFKVGDRVMARVFETEGPEGYAEGVVVKLWDSQHPYRIELQDEKKTNVWGLVDEDRYVTAFEDRYVQAAGA